MLAVIQVFAESDLWQALAVIVKALTYATSFFAGGGFLFVALFKGRLNVTEQASMRLAFRRAAILAILFSLMRIAVMNGMLGGEWLLMWSADLTLGVLQSREGLATGLRLAGLLLLLAALQIRPSITAALIGLLGTLLAMTSFAWMGHVSEVPGLAIPRVLIAVHLFAVAYWLGALWPLYRVASAREELPRISAIMQRFGRMAMGIVTLLLLAGAILLYWLLGPIDQLWKSAYGQIFVVKLASVALLLVFAAQNKLRLVPALLRGERSSLVKLRFSIQAEMTLAILILLATAAFTTLTGPAGLE